MSGGEHTVKNDYRRYHLWECDYATVVRKLVERHGMRGDVAKRMFTGGYIWDSFTKRQRANMLKSLRDLGVTFEVVKVKNKFHLLMLGTDRVKISKAIRQLSMDKKITHEQRWDMLFRLARGRFPNEDDDFEVALEFETLI